MLKSGVKLTGRVNIKTYENATELVGDVTINNIVVTTGQDYVASRMIANTADVMSHMAIGSSQTPQTLDDTALLQEIIRTSFYSVTQTGSEIEYVASFAPGLTSRSITEAGILNASSGGILLCRTTFPIITQSTSQTIAISWVVSVG